MAYLAVDKNGVECIFEAMPTRFYLYSEWEVDDEDYDTDMIQVPKGTIEKIIGRKITWDDNPVFLPLF